MGRRSIVAEEPISFLAVRPAVSEPGEPSGDVRKRTPHEQGRKARSMTLTFPTDEWPEAVRGLAARWGVRPGDVLVLAVARLMVAVEDGEVEGPDRPAGFHDRAGDVFDLPWEPG